MFDFGTILQGVGAISSLMGGEASNEAANQQVASGREAIAENRRQYDQTRADQAPWRGAGSSAINRLSYLLGLDTGGGEYGGGVEAADAIRARFAPHFTTQGQMREVFGANAGDSNAVSGVSTIRDPDFVNEAGLSAAVNAELQRQQAAQAASQPKGSDFGSLMRRFGLSDFQTDPGYQFRLSEGEKGINRSLAARGGLLSGAAIKEASRFNQDTASGEFDRAYGRFNNDQTNQFNRLAGVAGIGQQAQGVVSQVGANTATNNAGIIQGIGNAQAAGTVGRSNALTNAIDSLNQYNMMNRVGVRRGWSPSSNWNFDEGN